MSEQCCQEHKPPSWCLNMGMRIYWRIALPIAGLLLFAMVSYRAFNRNYRPARYFLWSSVRLDTDPLNGRAKFEMVCKEEEGCIDWDPNTLWGAPGWTAELLILSALPAFLIGMGITRGLARLGVNEVTTFMVVMPFALFGWYYFCGWLIDRRKIKR